LFVVHNPLTPKPPRSAYLAGQVGEHATAYPHNLIHYNKLDRGGHFAAWEQRQLFSEEMRASFRSLRT